jgi:hypothetical protein
VVPNLKIIGIDPGGTTGWAWLTVPRYCIWGDAPSQIVEWDYGEISGPETKQVEKLCSIARTAQSLDYKVGPALIIEGWDVRPGFKSTDQDDPLSPIRIGAMLSYAHYRKEMGEDIRIAFQSASLAKEAFTDDRLRAAGMYVRSSRHVRDATRHALTALRRARGSAPFREALWFNDQC